MSDAGTKDDLGKAPWHLVPYGALNKVVRVLDFGAQKYGAENWRQVDGWRWRYFNAAMRHTTAWFCGERRDPESGLHHLAHAVCCGLFIVAMELECER